LLEATAYHHMSFINLKAPRSKDIFNRLVYMTERKWCDELVSFSSHSKTVPIHFTFHYLEPERGHC